jgi:hypothetical protein
VFFDTLRIAWGTSSGGYTLAGRRYLPDFELSIKRGLPRQLARELLEAYKQQAGSLVDERAGPVSPVGGRTGPQVRAGAGRQAVDESPGAPRVRGQRGRALTPGGGVGPSAPVERKRTPRKRTIG